MVLFVCLMTFAGSLWQYGSELRYQQTVCPERLQLIHQKNNIFILQRFLYKSMPSYCFTNNLLLNATASFAMINNFPTISVLWKNCVTEKCKVETTPKKGNIFFFFPDQNQWVFMRAILSFWQASLHCTSTGLKMN